MTKIIITGQTPSHKNSKVMTLNRSTGKLFPRNNDRYLSWKGGAEVEILNQVRHRHRGTVGVIMTFFVKDRRPRDLDNMAASVLDVLVSTGSIDDDNVFVVPEISIHFGGISKSNPRAEITIQNLNDYPQVDIIGKEEKYEYTNL